MFNREDKIILECLQEGLEIIERPYEVIAEKAGLSEDETIERVRYFKDEGIIRSLKAVLNHKLLGYNSNVMVVWKIPVEKVYFAGKVIANFKEVSHCYEREVVEGWKYNLFTMVHGKNAVDCIKVIEEISQEIGIKDYEMLFTEEEYKKSYMRYFGEES
ncbi:MAG: Lrp/AsnC family transcriptional regulator [bacterium]|nr:Lrp/AsnC family transcriptional regulator [bacterium]